MVHPQRRSTSSYLGLVVSSGAIAAAAAGSPEAHAGGLFLPGIGAVSTARAGAATASTDNGEALLLNPARLTGLTGTQIMVGMSLFDLHLTFDRFGSYDEIDGRDLGWEGQDYPTVSDSSSPPVGIGPYQIIPMVAVTSNLDCYVPGLTVAAGIYAPQTFPTRELDSGYTIDDPVQPPPPSRYDSVEQGAELLVASVGAGYRVLPSLDVGGRLGFGFGEVRARSFLWGVPNFDEYTGNDADLELGATDNFMPSFGLGVSFRPHRSIELAAQYNSQLTFVGKGTARAQLSQYLSIAGVPAQLTATPDDQARCAKGGTDEVLKACVELTLPMSASIAGRYKFFDGQGRERGDIELDLGWESWGTERSSDFRVVVDAQVNGILTLKDGLIRHGFRDTFAARLGGSYRLPLGGSELVLRGGVSHDTAAAKERWERLDFDGASRTMLAAGVSYRFSRFQIDAGGGAILEGTRSVGGRCNPDVGDLGCEGTNSESDQEDRTGVDPINPIFEPDSQNESPVNHGEYSSHYVVLTLGATAFF